MDPGTEYRQLIRHHHPKRSSTHKIHRWRHTYEDDNLITKVILAELGSNHLAIQSEIYGLQWPPFDNKDYLKIVGEIDNDWTELSSGVLYSQKKKKRWLLPDLLEKELPVYDNFHLPFELITRTITRFQRHHTHCCGGVFWFSQIGLGQHQLRCLADNVKYLRMENNKGKTVIVKRAANPNLIKDLYKTNKSKDDSVPKLHVQFQSLQFKKVPKKHNSRIYDYHPSWEEDWSDPPVYEPHNVKKDVAFSGYLYCNDRQFYEGINYTYEEEEESTAFDSCRPWLNFGAFFDVLNIPRRKQRGSRCDLKDWVLV